MEKESACTLQDVMERGRGVLPYVAEARERVGGVEKDLSIVRMSGAQLPASAGRIL